MSLNWNEKGLTLIEMIFSIVIILTLTSAFYQLIISFNHHYEIQDAVAEMQQQGRVSTDLFIREIKQAGFDRTGALFSSGQVTKVRNIYLVDPPPPGGIGCQSNNYPVQRVLEATPTSFQFLADLNEDGDVDDPNDSREDIRYEWVGPASALDLCGNHRTPYTLYRDTGGGMQEVALNIESFNLRYFDEDDNELLPAPLLQVQRLSIRKVLLNLTARTGKKDPDYLNNGGYRTRSFVAEIYLKNL